MDSRETILSAILKTGYDKVAMPETDIFTNETEGLIDRYIAVATGVGGKVFQISDIREIEDIIKPQFKAEDRIISNISELTFAENISETVNDPHVLANVELAILKAHFAVAENSAIWVTEELTGHRVLPFVCQHLALIINKNNIVANMHQAYERIGMDNYNWGTFIAGPSKTADIEQSLVLGAHGPRSLTVFLYDKTVSTPNYFIVL
ncbi:MAG: lactate utilization protein B/C [Sphingobacteriales bacterium]|nr:MAG: lactate utilization protein B/C [Sphingobacteriales bacterium]